MDKQAVEVINYATRCVLPESKPTVEKVEVDVTAVLEEIVAEEDMPEEMTRRVTNFNNRLAARAHAEKERQYKAFLSDATSEELTTLAKQLKQTGNVEFDPLIQELHRMAAALIERAFPSDTDMTPEKLIEIVVENLEKQKVSH